jgi:hypothetical protein
MHLYSKCISKYNILAYCNSLQVLMLSAAMMLIGGALAIFPALFTMATMPFLFPIVIVAGAVAASVGTFVSANLCLMTVAYYKGYHHAPKPLVADKRDSSPSSTDVVTSNSVRAGGLEPGEMPFQGSRGPLFVKPTPGASSQSNVAHGDSYTPS